MPASPHNLSYYVTQTVSGVVTVNVISAVVGGIVTVYIVKKLDVWASRRSEKKRKQTIEQLRADIELLRPYHKDRDKLFINTAFFAFIILALLAASLAIGSIMWGASLILDSMAVALAAYWARSLNRIGRFEDYEKEIEARIRKLSKQGSTENVTHEVGLSTSVSSNASIQIEKIPAPVPVQPLDEWNITGGKWVIVPTGLELESVNADGTAAYIWRMEKLRLPALIKFRASFTAGRPGLRVNLFADSPTESYSISNHLQLLMPWELGGYKMDYMRNGPIPISGVVVGVQPSLGQTCFYELAVDLDNVVVHVNGQVQFVADLQSDPKIRQHLLEMPNSGGYWGFASDRSLFSINRPLA